MYNARDTPDVPVSSRLWHSRHSNSPYRPSGLRGMMGVGARPIANRTTREVDIMDVQSALVLVMAVLVYWWGLG